MIIKNTYQRNYLNLEDAVECMTTAILTRHPAFVIHTEMGNILFDVRFMLKAPDEDNVMVYRWGTEPPTDTVISYRHDKIDFYVHIQLPLGCMENKDIAHSAAAKAMAEIFINNITRPGPYPGQKLYKLLVDAIVFTYGSYHHTPGEGDAGIRPLLRLELRNELRTFGARNRRLANEVFNMRWKEREEAIRELDEMLEEVDDTGKIETLFNGNWFWTYMYRYAMHAAKNASITAIPINTTAEYLTTEDPKITWVTDSGSTSIPVSECTPYQFIHTLCNFPQELNKREKLPQAPAGRMGEAHTTSGRNGGIRKDNKRKEKIPGRPTDTSKKN